MPTIGVILLALGGYLLTGLVFALVFTTRLIGRFDPAATTSRWPFRLLIVPGVTALWPWMLARSLRPREVPHP